MTENILDNKGMTEKGKNDEIVKNIIQDSIVDSYRNELEVCFLLASCTG